ncbi:phosphoadenosine phosphosulfate reductase [Iodidimonas muriae]|uniref:Adenosine 5'-phosphosulfate reductase n=1 Tax=Iodidimonas muriae TaxID=261467 RepID=A0ABQ2LAY6_9PROT|nr:phosphoadenylyl-sulfate reductase [Iodidimonas muriae]GER06028.1 phosphoadenosine phosphosulfate reductase [Kordiimonadales bacterium JCM 17843]GGO07894.1 phosphoadenosine phosphosulfate reductase [Iodidimonas muriae]
MSYLDPDLSGPWAAVLSDRYGRADAQQLLTAMVHEVFPGRIALVSSFGAESAVLLHMLSEIDRHIPVLFVDTGKLFGETKRYRDQLVARLGLTNLQTISPDPNALSGKDPKGLLFAQNPDACCYWRKVEPLERALKGYGAWISGRKQFHGGARTHLTRIEAADKRIKISPLADWSRADIERYFDQYDLPKHPLEADGYLSIGCMPCTQRVAPGGDIRSGRWSGLDKTECGIHLSLSNARKQASL